MGSQSDLDWVVALKMDISWQPENRVFRREQVETGKGIRLVSHLRFVHNTLTIFSFVLIYLVWSAGISRTGLLRELTSFLEVADNARSFIEGPNRLRDLVPAVRDGKLRAAMASEVFDATGHIVRVAEVPLQVVSVSPLPDETATIAAQWQALRKHEWKIQTIGSIEGAWSDIREWFDEDSRNLDRALRAGLSPSRSLLNDIKTRAQYVPLLRLFVKDWPTNSQSGSTFVEIQAYIVIPAVLPQVKLTRKSFGPYPFNSELTTVGLPSDVFDRFSFVQRQMDEIGERTPTEALEWAAGQQVAGIRGLKPPILGASVRAEDLRVVGPVTLILIQVYLLMITVMFRESTIGDRCELREWPLTNKHPLGRIYSFLTLILLPPTAISLILWHFTAVSWIIGIPVVLVPCSIGVTTFVVGIKFNGRD